MRLLCGVDNGIETYHIGVGALLWTVLHIMHKTHVTSAQTASGLALPAVLNLWPLSNDCMSSFLKYSLYMPP